MKQKIARKLELVEVAKQLSADVNVASQKPTDESSAYWQRNGTCWMLLWWWRNDRNAKLQLEIRDQNQKERTKEIRRKERNEQKQFEREMLKDRRSWEKRKEEWQKKRQFKLDERQLNNNRQRTKARSCQETQEV